MNRIAQESSEARYLDNFAKLTNVITEHVQKKHLLPHKMPCWVWPEGQQLPLGDFGQWLHRLYGPRGWLARFFPFRPTLMLGLVFSAFFVVGYPHLIAFVSSTPIFSIQLSPRAVGLLLLLLAFLLLSVLVPVLTAIGVYWILIELISNRHLTLRLRVTALLIVLIYAGTYAGVWCAQDSIPPSDASIDSGGTHIEQTVHVIRQAPAYRAISAILFIVPCFTCFALMVVGGTAVAAWCVGSAFHWFYSLHILHPVERIKDFLSTPLSLNEGEQQTLLQLETTQIDALYNWSVCRRQAVQNRLLPTTMLLAFLGLLANTSLGESAVQSALTILCDYFSDIGSLSWLVGSWRLLPLVAITLLPGIPVLLLMNEAFTMDFVAQACLLARHVKLSREDESATQDRGQKPVGLLGAIGQWLFGLDRFIQRRRRE
jgi:hypothetical protein